MKLTFEQRAERFRALHPRVSVGNDSPAWFKSGRIIYGPTLDGKYHGAPRCLTFEGALLKAEKLSAGLRKGETCD